MLSMDYLIPPTTFWDRFLLLYFEMKNCSYDSLSDWPKLEYRSSASRVWAHVLKQKFYHYCFCSFCWVQQIGDCCQCSFQVERATRTCGTTWEVTGLRKAWIYCGCLKEWWWYKVGRPVGCISGCCPWFSELIRVHGLLLDLLAALPWGDLGYRKVVQSGSSGGDTFGPFWALSWLVFMEKVYFQRTPLLGLRISWHRDAVSPGPEKSLCGNTLRRKNGRKQSWCTDELIQITGAGWVLSSYTNKDSHSYPNAQCVKIGIVMHTAQCLAHSNSWNAF